MRVGSLLVCLLLCPGCTGPQSTPQDAAGKRDLSEEMPGERYDTSALPTIAEFFQKTPGDMTDEQLLGELSDMEGLAEEDKQYLEGRQARFKKEITADRQIDPAKLTPVGIERVGKVGGVERVEKPQRGGPERIERIRPERIERVERPQRGGLEKIERIGEVEGVERIGDR